MAQRESPITPEPRDRSRHIRGRGSQLLGLKAGIGINKWGYCLALKKRGGEAKIALQRYFKAARSVREALDECLSQAEGRGIPRSLSIGLPISHIELISIKVPELPQEAIRDALRFRLKKMVSRPIDEYSFDYVEIKREQGAIQFEVYLLDLTIFDELDNVARRYGQRITAIEPDIFSISAHLQVHAPAYAEGGAMVVAIWHDSVSLGILSEDRICVSRSINLSLPALDQDGQTSKEIPEEDEGPDQENLLVRFGISGEGHDRPDDAKTPSNLSLEEIPEINEDDPPPFSEPAIDPMEEYCQDILVQIMRTRDYYTSVLKMGVVKHIAIFAPEELGPKVKKCLLDEMAVDVDFMGEPLCRAAMGAATR